ncbi:APC family permease [Latilactobacillus sakei]
MLEKNKMSLFSLVMLGLSSIIGSGWLFGAWEATTVAGPAAIISWIVGAIVIGAIAFNYVELGTMFPESGGMSHYAQYSHGSLLGFIASWSNWVSLVTIIPIEAVAAVQYMSSWPWSWANWTNRFMHHNEISTRGLLVVFAFIIVFTLLNFWSVKFLTRFTSFIAIFKLAIPLLTIIMLVSTGFHSENFGHSVATFMPYGSAKIFAATSISGIIFSYNAFQTVINVGSEIRDSKRNIGRGIAISLGISIVIYLLLQITFIGAVSPALIAKTGWHGLNFQSPFADLAILLGIHWLAVLLYLDAFISPFGTGVSFVASCARTLAALKQNKHMPPIVGKMNHQYNIPRVAMAINAVVSMLLVSVFRSRGTLAGVISTATLIAYLTGPVTVMSLRKMAPDMNRPVHSPWMKVMAPLSFVLASLATYWAMWPTTIKVIGVIMLGLPFYFYYEYRIHWENTRAQFKGSLWLIIYLALLSLISFLGSREFNGINVIPYPLDFVLISALALIFYYWGIISRFYSKYFSRAKRINQDVQL